MIEFIICIGWLIACVVAVEMFCEGKERSRFDQQFFAVCLAVFLAAFGLGRWL